MSSAVVYNITNNTKGVPVPGVYVFCGVAEDEVEGMLQRELDSKDDFEFDVYNRRTDKEWEKYVQDQLDIPSLMHQLQLQEPYDDEGTSLRSLYIGTVFNLTPSGKYYMPFACSNVMGCIEPCFDGNVVNGFTDPRRFAFLKGLHDQMTEFCGQHGFAGMGNALSGIRDAMNSCGEQITCPVCNGIGSKEATEDEDWREALERVLGEEGCWLGCGEGDPCDMFVYCHTVEEEVDV